MLTPRQHFLDAVRHVPGTPPVVSPFLPKPSLIAHTLRTFKMDVHDDPIANECRLARTLNYQPMFMTACHTLIFPWEVDETSSDASHVVMTLPTGEGLWTRRVSRGYDGMADILDTEGFPVKTEADHAKLQAVCRTIAAREATIRLYFRNFRQRVGEEGVIVIGHPHVTWLSYQISQEDMVYHMIDYPEAFTRSMEAIFEAACYVFTIAIEEGIDFMSESSYGLEMISPRQFAAQDLVYSQRLADWTHERGGLMWHHNCGKTRELIRRGYFDFDQLGADVFETVAPPPEGDNDLATSRRWLNPQVCSKGNLNLDLLRHGTVDQVIEATKKMVRAAAGFAHIHSTADAVYAETPPENFIAFVRTARDEAEQR
jgi:uroporphyrinogen-III decarboxylase